MNRKNAQNIGPSSFAGSGGSAVAATPTPSTQRQTPGLGGNPSTTQTLQGRGTPARQGSGPTAEEIRVRAFQIFLARKGGNGSSESDWLQAERELRAGRTPR